MPANATAPIAPRVMLERVVDDLDEIEQIVWADRKTQLARDDLSDYDCARLRVLAGESLELATLALDAV